MEIVNDNTCSWGVIDVDRYNIQHQEVIQIIRKRKYPLVPFRSKSNGLHLILFIDFYSLFLFKKLYWSGNFEIWIILHSKPRETMWWCIADALPKPSPSGLMWVDRTIRLEFLISWYNFFQFNITDKDLEFKNFLY